MARDFPIRIDLHNLGLPERSIRVLEKAAQLVQLIEDQAALTDQVTAIDGAVDALQESQEDQDLSLTSLDSRLDVFEDFSATDPRYAKKAGDTFTGAVDVQALLTCDSFRIDAAPTAAVIASTHKLAISCNGVTYYLLLSNV